MKYHKTIIFTKTRLTGYFRYKDFFQIYPADFEETPSSRFQKHYPIILEYTTNDADIILPDSDFEGLEELRTLAATTLTKQDQILPLLSTLTNHLFFRYDNNGHWGIPLLTEEIGEEMNTWSSKWCLKLFHYPSLPNDLKISEFSNPSLREVKYINSDLYFQYNPNIDFYPETPITFPSLINNALDSYYNLSSKVKTQIDKSISHVYSAIELSANKKTLSIISAFTAIEGMVNIENLNQKAEKCESCGQLKHKVSQKYRDFLLKYIGDSTHNKKKFNEFYSLRSKIIHTGEKLETEHLWNNLPKAKKEEEFLKHHEIIQMSRLSVIKWIINNKTAYNIV